MYKFEVTLDDNDYLEFNRHFIKTSKSQRRAYLSMSFRVPFFMTLFVFLLYHMYGTGAGFWLGIAVLIIAAFL